MRKSIILIQNTKLSELSYHDTYKENMRKENHEKIINDLILKNNNINNEVLLENKKKVNTEILRYLYDFIYIYVHICMYMYEYT
jgi:serine kinase of HPr protein (carbohydrate metabolism regulator)